MDFICKVLLPGNQFNIELCKIILIYATALAVNMCKEENNRILHISLGRKMGLHSFLSAGIL